jgi:hypothetical protein
MCLYYFNMELNRNLFLKIKFLSCVEQGYKNDFEYNKRAVFFVGCQFS